MNAHVRQIAVGCILWRGIQAVVVELLDVSPDGATAEAGTCLVSVPSTGLCKLAKSSFACKHASYRIYAATATIKPATTREPTASVETGSVPPIETNNAQAMTVKTGNWGVQIIDDIRVQNFIGLVIRGLFNLALDAQSVGLCT